MCSSCDCEWKGGDHCLPCPKGLLSSAVRAWSKSKTRDLRWRDQTWRPAASGLRGGRETVLPGPSPAAGPPPAARSPMLLVKWMVCERHLYLHELSDSVRAACGRAGPRTPPNQVLGVLFTPQSLGLRLHFSVCVSM